MVKARTIADDVNAILREVRREPANPDYVPQASFCPFCGNSLRRAESFIVEYWRSDQSVYFCWCDRCKRKSEVTAVNRIITSELEEG